MSANVDKLHVLLARVQRVRESRRAAAPAPSATDEIDIDIDLRSHSKTPLKLEPVPNEALDATEVLRTLEKQTRGSRPAIVEPPPVPAEPRSKSQRTQLVKGATQEVWPEISATSFRDVFVVADAAEGQESFMQALQRSLGLRVR